MTIPVYADRSVSLSTGIAGPFLDLRSPLGVTPAALKTSPVVTPAQTPEPSPSEKLRRGSQPGSTPQPKRELAIKRGEDNLLTRLHGASAFLDVNIIQAAS